MTTGILDETFHAVETGFAERFQHVERGKEKHARAAGGVEDGDAVAELFERRQWSWTLDSYLVFSEHDEAAAPTSDLGGNGADGFQQCLSARFAQADEQQARAPGVNWRVSEKSRSCVMRKRLSALTACQISASGLPLRCSLGTVSTSCPCLCKTGINLAGRFSSADTAAKATTARTASRLSVGKSCRSSSVLIPSARLARMVRTVIRVPVMTGSPPQIAGDIGLEVHGHGYFSFQG